MIVLDTHALIWAVQDDALLGRNASAQIDATAREDRILVPVMCAWEVAMIEKRGKVVFPGGASLWFRRIVESPAFVLAPLEPEIAIESVRMDWDHRDPADRIMVATARHWKMPLVTADEKILAYAAAGHLEAIDARV